MKRKKVKIKQRVHLEASPTIDYCEEYEKIKKDLEVLEILKKHIEINIYGTDAGDKKAIDILIFEDDENFGTINNYISKTKSD